MTKIVLIHGGWHAGWCWKKVAPLLRAAGRSGHLAAAHIYLLYGQASRGLARATRKETARGYELAIPRAGKRA